MWTQALQDPTQIQRACAPDCGGQGMAETGSAPIAQTVQTQLVHLSEQLHRLLHLVWLDMQQAVEATRPLAEACLLWLRHMTPDTSHLLGKAALQWLAAPAVQHVLIGSAALLLLLYLLFRSKPQPARPTRAAAAAARPRRSASGWQAAAMGAAGGGAAMAAAAAFADPATHETWPHHDQNLGDDAFPGGLHSSFMHEDSALSTSGVCINPANGLPMMGDGCGGVDIMGNTYGTDSNDSFSSSWSDDSFSSNTWSSDDSWSSSSSWDDHSISSSSWD